MIIARGGWNFYHNAKEVKGIARSGLQGGGAFGNKNKQYFNEITNNVYENKKITTQHKSYGSDFGADKKEFYKEINKGIYKIDENLENVGGGNG